VSASPTIVIITSAAVRQIDERTRPGFFLSSCAGTKGVRLAWARYWQRMVFRLARINTSCELVPHAFVRAMPIHHGDYVRRSSRWTERCATGSGFQNGTWPSFFPSQNVNGEQTPLPHWLPSSPVSFCADGTSVLIQARIREEGMWLPHERERSQEPGSDGLVPHPGDIRDRLQKQGHKTSDLMIVDLHDHLPSPASALRKPREGHVRPCDRQPRAAQRCVPPFAMAAALVALPHPTAQMSDHIAPGNLALPLPRARSFLTMAVGLPAGGTCRFQAGAPTEPERGLLH
jgi:hypothetical protein